MRRPAPSPFWLDAASDLPATSRLPSWGAWAVFWVMSSAAAVVFTWLSLARHAAFQSHAFDLGNMDQAVWNTLHGRPFRFTDMAVGHAVLTTRLAIHVEPLLAALAPLYLLHSGAETLLVAQAVVVASGAIPAYLLARAVLGGPWMALIFPAAYLLHPSLQNAILDDFHAVTMSACFLLWAVYFLYRDIVPGFAVASVLAAATKEEVGLLVAAMGLWLLFRRRVYAGLMAITCGIGWFLVSVLLIIPAENPAGHSPYLARYAYLGHGLGGILLGIARHPQLVSDTLLSNARLAYLDDLLHPLGFAGVLGLPVLALALPGLLINMLSADPTMYSGFFQYSAEIVPFVIAAAVLGAGWLSRLASRLRAPGAEWMGAVLCSLVLVASFVDSWEYGFTPLARGYLVPSAGTHQAIERRLLDALPAGSVVAAADEMVPHLSDRRWVYLLPTLHPRNGPPAQFVALDAMIAGLPVEPRTLREVAIRALGAGYGVQAARDGVLVLRRGARRKTLPAGFYSFLFQRTGHAVPQSATWGRLRLVGSVVHPQIGVVNRSRPAIAVETYWRVSGAGAGPARITFYLSPVYQGSHPRFSARWQRDADSPAWDWLPISRWPVGRVVRAASLPLLPAPYSHGLVDVAVGVAGLGQATRVGAAPYVTASIIRVATVRVEP